MRWPYTPERVRLESLEWAEFLLRSKLRDHHVRGGPPKGCAFQGQTYPSIAAASRAVGRSKKWMLARGLIIFEDL